MKNKKDVIYLSVGLFITGTLLLVLLLPNTYFKLGNIFFGDIPALYNLNLAQRFYIMAAYPMVGKAPLFAHYQLSRTYFIQGNLLDALDEALNELILYPENDRTYYIIGLTYGYMNREHEAIGAFTKFIKKNPSSWAARNDKAWLQFRIGDITGGLETIEPVSTLVNPWVQNTYGTLLMNAGRPKEAEQAFLRASEIIGKYSNESWGNAYPGNDPRIYDNGLASMQQSITSNLQLLQASVE